MPLYVRLDKTGAEAARLPARLAKAVCMFKKDRSGCKKHCCASAPVPPVHLYDESCYEAKRW
jgi:hypothetical protein